MPIPFSTTFGTLPIDLVNDEKDMRVVTRLNDRDILTGVLDPESIADLQDAGAKVRFHDNSLHAKLWVFDDLAVIGSANLTRQALRTNVEVVVKRRGSNLSALADDFAEIWRSLRMNTRGSGDLRALAERLSNHPARRRFQQVREHNGLVDYGGLGVSHQEGTRRDSGFWLKVNVLEK